MMISELEEGAKLLIAESGASAVYTLVHHGYGEAGLSLLWRDECLTETVIFNSVQDSFLSTSDGALDKYLNETFYAS